MPVYFFTYHAYGTWLPDHRRGYVDRRSGIQPSNEVAAERYRAPMTQSVVWFTPEMQRLLVETACRAGGFLDAVVHAVYSEPTHVHVLMSWRKERGWLPMRSSVKTALSRAMSERYGKRSWWVDGASRRHVKGYAHFDYLMTRYAAKHHGAKWACEMTLRGVRRRAARPA